MKNETEVICFAPDCKRVVRVNRWSHFFNKLSSLIRGGSFSAAVFCPEHDERVNGVDDNDPNTNPDLNK